MPDSEYAHLPSASDERRRQAEDRFWMVIATILRRRFLLLGGAVVIGLASIAVSLALPKWYLGQAVVVVPQSPNRSDLGLTLRELGPAAGAFLLETGGDMYRYQAILYSRGVRERTIDGFDLIREYGTQDEEDPLGEALDALDENLFIEHDIEYDQLIVSVFDRSPQRAADMANFLVDELNRVNARLLSSNATRNRSFLEQRYARIEAALDSTRSSLQRFQEAHGVVELEAQTSAFLDMIADYRSEVLLGELEVETRRISYGDENPIVRSALNRVRAAREKERRLQSGSDALLPISFRELPQRLQEFAALKQEALIQAKMLELVRPLLEQARFEEIRATPAVQVLDRATPPAKKAKPRRSLVVIALTCSGCLLLLFVVLTAEWWRRNRVILRSRLHG